MRCSVDVGQVYQTGEHGAILPKRLCSDGLNPKMMIVIESWTTWGRERKIGDEALTVLGSIITHFYAGERFDFGGSRMGCG
jgi:hypothetical protein